MSNPNDPAYATSGLSGLPNGEFIYGQPGMTTRQEFVKAAMQGLCASEKWMGGDDVTQIELERGIAIHAVRIADAALAEEARTRSKA